MRDNRNAIPTTPDNRIVLQEGVVMRSKDKKWLNFRPDRGSGGFALYQNEQKARTYSPDGDETAIKVRLVLERVEP